VTVYSGATGAVLNTFFGVAAQDRLGYSGCEVGDVNGDGHSEVIVGTYIPTGLGYARVYSGIDGSVMYHLTDGVIGDAFGHTVAGVADVNGDGKPDFAVSAPLSNVNGSLSGFVRVYSGADGSILKQFNGYASGIHYGYSVNPAGDVNADGLPDIAIGSLIPSSLGIPGSATVVSICAAQPYGGGLLPTQTLDFSWVQGPSGLESLGAPMISGAQPGAIGLLAANGAPGNLTVFDVPILFDVSTPFLLLEVTFDGSGALTFPLDLRNSALAGIAFYLQAFEANANAPQGVYASNAMLLLFGP
jgi:hypothetical protein